VSGTGRVAGGEVAVDASASSQFVSALLLAAPRFERGLVLRHTGDRLPSTPHIEMTLETLRAAGVDATSPQPGLWQVAPGPVAGHEVDVEPDLSSAAPFVAAAAATGGSVTVTGWPARTTQAGDQLRGILSAMGCTVQLTDSGELTVTGPPAAELRGLDIDLHDVGELTPVVAALCALAATPSRIRGVAHLRGHETDRLAALESELCRMGAEVAQTEDGLHITPARLYPAQLQTYEDHRMVHAAALLALRVPGTEVLDAETVAKTFPGFERVWTSLVLGHGATAMSASGS
jgi:3-phosphoshikimate 1-carboxyvinyltransferase